jgi:DNA-binding MurR/RpiR family transcriptional regulator
MTPDQPPSSDDARDGRRGPEWFADLVSRRQLTPKGKELAQYVAINPRLASFSSASELAGQMGVNAATVVRFAQALGFKGWPEFQLHFRHRYLGTLLPSDVMADQALRVGTAPAAEEALRRDIHNLEAALSSVDFGEVERVAETIAGARRTLCIASGSYAAVASVLAHHASFMGYDVAVETRGGPHIVAALAGMRPGDCVVSVSFWRLVRDVVAATESSRKRGLTTVAITDSVFSPLARAADHALVVPTESVSFFQSMTAALSLVYGLLAELHKLGGEEVNRTIVDAQSLYDDLNVLY